MNIALILQIGIIISGVITVGLILLNQPQTDNTFGGSNSFHITRRGIEKSMHTMTIVSAVLFVVLILISKIV